MLTHGVLDVMPLLFMTWIDLYEFMGMTLLWYIIAMVSRNWSRASTPFKTQLDYVNDRKSDSDDSKYPESSDKEGDHGKRHRSKKVNPALTLKRGTNERQKD